MKVRLKQQYTTKLIENLLRLFDAIAMEAGFTTRLPINIKRAAVGLLDDLRH